MCTALVAMVLGGAASGCATSRREAFLASARHEIEPSPGSGEPLVLPVADGPGPRGW